MEKLTVTEALAEIERCNKRFLFFQNLHGQLAGWESELPTEAEKSINAEIAAGDITTLVQLAERFYQLANFEYNTANNLLKSIKNKL